MGFLWALLMPCLVLGASLLVRALISRGGVDPASSGEALAGPALKAWAWAFVVGSLNFSTTSLLNNINLVSKIYFPREVLPLAAVGAQIVDSLVGLAFIICLAPLLGMHWTLNLLWLFPLIGLLVLLTSGLSLFLSAANVFYRDVKYLVQVAVTFGIFATPVLFGLDSLGPTARRLMWLNPLTPVLEGLRLVTSHGSNLAYTVAAPAGGAPYWTPWALLGSAVFGVIVLAGSERYFRAHSDRFAELA